MKRVVGITGGIASGKSNVCSIIRNSGFQVIDCDKISHDIILKGTKAYDQIINEFGDGFIDDEGQINRKKLGKLVFNDLKAKKVLEAITHPIIKEELNKQINDSNEELLFVETPLLYEAKLEEIFDYVICVFLPKKIQVERLIVREGIDEDYALAKIHSQMDLYMKKTLADFVVDSRGSFEQTKMQVDNIINIIKGV